MSNIWQKIGSAINDSLEGWEELGSRVVHIFGQNTAKEQNAFNAEQAQLNRDFQERMSNTSWQRGVEDMQAAGLNSALAYNQGGASVPSGSTASASQGGQALVQIAGALIGALSGVSKAAMSANSALSVASLRNQGAMNVASLRDSSARAVADIIGANNHITADKYNRAYNRRWAIEFATRHGVDPMPYL